MISFLKNLLSRRRVPDDRVVIDQKSHYDAMEANCRRIRDTERAIEKEREIGRSSSPIPTTNGARAADRG